MNTSDPVIPPSLGSLHGNSLGAGGVKAIAAVLKDSQLSTLGCAATPNLHSAYTRQSPMNAFEMPPLAAARQAQK